MPMAPRRVTWKRGCAGVGVLAIAVTLASCGGDSATSSATTDAPRSTSTTRKAADELREIQCPAGWGYGGLTIINRFVEKVRIVINPVDPAFWTVSPDQLQGTELHFGQGWGTYTESCIQLAKAMAAGARFVIGFEPVARPNYPTAPPFVPPVEVEMLPYVPKNKKGKFIGGNWVLWGAAGAGSCTQRYTQSVDTDKYGRMSVDIECPPSAEYYTFPTIITIYR